MGFVKGMDVSMAKALEAHGASYYLDGKQDDLFRILKKCGTDMIRVSRPERTIPEDGCFTTSTLEHEEIL